jgi:hypothetical protein
MLSVIKGRLLIYSTTHVRRWTSSKLTLNPRKKITRIVVISKMFGYHRKILYFVDRASRYNSLLMTNLTHFFIYLFISSLYAFQASQCPSSGDRIVLIHHHIIIIIIHNHTRWCINTIRSPDDGRCDAWNMYRDEINKYIKKYVKLVISKELYS